MSHRNIIPARRIMSMIASDPNVSRIFATAIVPATRPIEPTRAELLEALFDIRELAVMDTYEPNVARGNEGSYEAAIIERAQFRKIVALLARVEGAEYFDEADAADSLAAREAA